MKLKFTKMQGAGNDYIYVNGFKERLEDPSAVAVRVSDRHFGVGGDGLVLILPSDVADVRMRMFNADGSEGKMCGNASRCVAKYAYERGLVKKKEMTLETLSGMKHMKLSVENGVVTEVTVDMGAPVLCAAEIPMDLAFAGENTEDTFIDQPVLAGDRKWYVTAVSMGNPHGVIFTREDVERLELAKLGPPMEEHPLFPQRVNTEFVNVLSPTHLKMRVWERGSGETLACGTGACAAAVAAVLNGHASKEEEITVSLRGGDLKICWSSGGTVFMTGPAAFVFDGEIEL